MVSQPLSTMQSFRSCRPLKSWLQLGSTKGMLKGNSVWLLELGRKHAEKVTGYFSALIIKHKPTYQVTGDTKKVISPIACSI